MDCAAVHAHTHAHTHMHIGRCMVIIAHKRRRTVSPADINTDVDAGMQALNTAALRVSAIHLRPLLTAVSPQAQSRVMLPPRASSATSTRLLVVPSSHLETELVPVLNTTHCKAADGRA